MKKSSGRAREKSRELERAQQDTAVCPTCGRPFERDISDDVVLVPDLVDTDDAPVPAASGPRAEAPTDADVEWALSPPLTAEKREFLRAATQSVAVEQDRFDTKAAELAAFEAMWPPRNPGERRKES